MRATSRAMTGVEVDQDGSQPVNGSSRLVVGVAYHQSGPHPVDAQRPYVAVCNVQADGSRPRGFTNYVTVGGDPGRNALYGELTVQRHLNAARASRIGLCHYRRVFLTRPPKGAREMAPAVWQLNGWDWAHIAAVGADEESLLQAATPYNWCTAPLQDTRLAGYRSLWDQYCANHPARLAHAANAAVRDLHPDLPSFVGHLRGSSTFPPFNMFLCRRELFLSYGEFLWPVLARCEARIGRPNHAYQQRYLGFLAERLHAYWLEHVARPKGVVLGQLPVAILEVSGIRNSSAPRQLPVIGGSPLRQPAGLVARTVIDLRAALLGPGLVASGRRARATLYRASAGDHHQGADRGNKARRGPREE